MPGTETWKVSYGYRATMNSNHCRRYNETIQSLRIQMENNRKMAELVSMAQNKQLESQFNPHFLYNTLENIRYMCKAGAATAERMVFSLVKPSALQSGRQQGRG